MGISLLIYFALGYRFKLFGSYRMSGSPIFCSRNERIPKTDTAAFSEH